MSILAYQVFPQHFQAILILTKFSRGEFSLLDFQTTFFRKVSKFYLLNFYLNILTMRKNEILALTNERSGICHERITRPSLLIPLIYVISENIFISNYVLIFHHKLRRHPSQVCRIVFRRTIKKS